MIRCLHVWLPDRPGSLGGIQMFSEHLLGALETSDQVGRIRVIVKNEANVPEKPSGANLRFHAAGRGPVALRTVRFVALASALAVRDRPDLILSVHANFSPAAALLKRWLNIPYWVVAHGIDVWNLPAGRVRSALVAADRVLPVSGFTRERLLAELPLNPNRVLVLPNTVDPCRFKPGPKPKYLLARHGLRAEQRVILTVGRLEGPDRCKGHDQVLRALPEVLAAIPDAHYMIGGRGPDLQRLQSLVAELGLTDRVTLTGFITDEELPDYYRLADVFAMPSKREGFGIVYLEAMACGIPVLAGNKDGASDALRGGELGALVDPDDVEEIARTLIELLLGTSSRPGLCQPEALRTAMLAAYGPDRFRTRLSELLETC